MSITLEDIRDADCLSALRDLLVAYGEQAETEDEHEELVTPAYETLITELPTFGGEALAIEGVYSWDATHMLVDGAGGWELMAREELA